MARLDAGRRKLAFDFSIKATLENPAWQPFLDKSVIQPAFKALDIPTSDDRFKTDLVDLRIDCSPVEASSRWSGPAYEPAKDRLVVAKM